MVRPYALQPPQRQERGCDRIDHALAQYLGEFASFPYGRFDDQVDSTAQMLDWFKASGREDGIFALYRQLAAERKARQQG